MREINECTAEVFRRSEKRIQRRKRNRNHILTLCFSFCLIVTAWTVVLPAMMSNLIKKSETAPEMVGDGSESFDCTYTAVEIQNDDLLPEHCEKVTDEAAVAKIFSAIDSLFEEVGRTDQNGGAETNEGDGNLAQPGSTSPWKSYTITFTTEDGSQTVYNLSGNSLLNVDTNETVVLSDNQVAELMTVFGISE